MFKFHERRKLRQFLFSKITLLILFVLALFFANSVWDVYQKQRETAFKRERVEKELSELREREASLRSEIERIESPRGLEAELRARFEVGHEGEGVIVIIDPKEDDSETHVKESVGLWERIQAWFE